MKELSFIFSILFIFMLSSCDKDFIDEEKTFDELCMNDKENIEGLYLNDGLTILGEELPIVYTIDNMNAAYNSLKSQGHDLPDFKAKTTHIYLRFLPKDFNELDLLKKDSTITLFDVPLHYEIKKQGRYYRDSTLAEDQITWQYCVFDVNKEIPEVYFEPNGEANRKLTLVNRTSELN